MKAVVYTEYGEPEVLRLTEIAKPEITDSEVLVEIKYTTVTVADHRLRAMDVPQGFGFVFKLAMGYNAPKNQILGSELSGVIVEVGKAVTKFKVGDEVFAFNGMKMRSYAEYKAIDENEPIVLKPQNLSFAEAAALSFGGTTALYFLRAAKIKAGESILINGASGGVGTAAIQLAKYFGAEVTAVCSTGNIEMVKSLGADHVIDYTQEDFTKNGKQYDMIMDNAGTAPFGKAKQSLKPGGRQLQVLADLPEMIRSKLQSLFGGKKVISGTASEKVEDLQFLAKLAEEGKFTPVIDREYPLAKIVEAHRYVDTGHKRGNVVVKVA